MEYKSLRTLFHMSETDASRAYDARTKSKNSTRIDLRICGYESFFLMDSEIYKLILRSERLSSQIDSLAGSLPGKAIDQYMVNCMIDEIVLTNAIEGVNSSRREIGKVLKRLEKNDRKGRFHGIVEKYLALGADKTISLESSEDIRQIYDDLVLEEVVAENKDNAPDGRIFRARGVSVYDAAQREIHHGLEPEDKIIEVIDSGLRLLNSKDIEMLVRVALFHFIFAYAHPFYDGNGRTNRFISSYILTRDFNTLVGYRLSYSIKEQIDKYYKAFEICEHPLNKGDLTPFVIMFSEIVVDAMESMRDSLQEKKASLVDFENKIPLIPEINDGRESVSRELKVLADLLVQAALFAELGISPNDMVQIVRVSPPTLYKRLRFFEQKSLINKRQAGHNVFYAMNLDLLNEVVAQ